MTASLRSLLRASAWLLFAVAPACGPQEGSIRFTTWGEPFIEEGIPATAFEDGWAVQFERFALGLGRVRVAASDGQVGAEQTTGVVVDHVSPGVKEVAVFEGLAARSWDEVSFEIGPPSADWSVLPSGSPDLDALVANGTSVEVSFVATKSGITKKVEWTFDSATRFESCQGELDGQERDGAIVTAGGTDEVELTIHGDHLFYDDLASPTAVLRFDAMAAADADADDLVTLAELDSVDLVDIADGTYGTGSVSDVNTLGDFVRHLVRSLAHFRGEGECVAVPLP